jgi:hypothetical protein
VLDSGRIPPPTPRRGAGATPKRGSRPPSHNPPPRFFCVERMDWS